MLPLILGGIAVVTSGIALYESMSNGDTNQYISNYNTQIKNNEIIIGSDARIGELTIKDRMTSTQTAEGEISGSDKLTPVMMAVGVAGLIYLINKKGGKK